MWETKIGNDTQHRSPAGPLKPFRSDLKSNEDIALEGTKRPCITEFRQGDCYRFHTGDLSVFWF